MLAVINSTKGIKKFKEDAKSLGLGVNKIMVL